MTDLPIRRLVWTLFFYLAGAFLVLRAGAWVRRLLILPELFETLLAGGLVLGLPLALAVAWRYPRVGNTPDPFRDGPGSTS